MEKKDEGGILLNNTLRMKSQTGTEKDSEFRATGGLSV